MKKLIIAVILLFVSFSAFGQDKWLDMTGLSEVQKAEMAKMAAEVREKNKKVTLEGTVKNGVAQVVTQSTPAKVSEWAELGKNLGLGLANAAKEVGVAANDFVKTPVGKITAAIIVWKLVGESLYNTVMDIFRRMFGVIFLTCYTTGWYVAFRRVCIIDSVSYVESAHPTNEKKILKKKVIDYGNKWERTTGDTVAFFLLTLLVGLIPGTLIVIL